MASRSSTYTHIHIHTRTHTHEQQTSPEEPRRVRAKEQRKGCENSSLTSFAANINQFRAHLPSTVIRRLILT